MSRRRHLVLALSPKSWGRPNTAYVVAKELASMGDKVIFITVESIATLMGCASFEVITICGNMGPLIALYLNDLIARFSPTDIILSDYLGNATFLQCNERTLQEVIPVDTCTFMIDAFNIAMSGDKIDLFGVEQHPFISQEDWKRFVCAAHCLIPAPLGYAGAIPLCFRNLPDHPAAPNPGVLRGQLGLPSKAKIVLLCTAVWQHTHYQVGHAGQQLSKMLPAFLAHYISQLGTAVHLVHVGPDKLEIGSELDGRYHWLSSMPAQDFDALLAASDLLLSANISATTIGKAMAFNVPNLVIQNSIMANELQDADTALQPQSSLFVREWLARVIPLHPFALWPLGYQRYLAPLLQSNPYCNALDIVELFDEARLEERLDALLFHATQREDHMNRQHSYVTAIRKLPTGGELVQQLTEGRV